MKALRLALAVVVAVGLLFVVYAWQIEPLQIGVTRLTLPSRLAGALAGNRLVFLSDTHITGDWRKAEKLLAILRQLQPDYLLLGGDLVQYGQSVDPVVDWLKLLPKTKGAFAVLGDSDYSGRVRNCAYCHIPGQRTLRTDLPVRFLRNEAVTLADGRAVLVGLDGEDKAGWIGAFNRRPRPEAPAIVLVHYPTAATRLAGGFDLLLAGDTHGGQIALPGRLLDRLARESLSPFRAGWFLVNRAPLYVTRGIGEGYFPVRFLTPPEVVVLEGSS